MRPATPEVGRFDSVLAETSADAHEQHEVARDELRAIGQAIDLLPDPRQRDVVRMTI